MPKLESRPRLTRRTRLLSKAEVLKRVGVTYPTIWKWMMAGKFPRSRLLGEPGSKTARVCWLENEIDAWVAGLPVQQLKGDRVAEVA